MSQQFSVLPACSRYVDLYKENVAYVKQSKDSAEKLQAELQKLAANKDELGKVKFLLAQQQEKINSVSTALEQTKQEVATLKTTYTQDQANLKADYERDINRLKREGAGLHVQEREKARKIAYESDKASLTDKHQESLAQYQQVQKQQEESLTQLRVEEQKLVAQQHDLEKAAKRGNVDQKIRAKTNPRQQLRRRRSLGETSYYRITKRPTCYIRRPS